jgi:pSer/pThr/pTyr-binding forkhead associated (FHA) protein
MDGSSEFNLNQKKVYLVYNGQIFPIVQPVTRIGRKLDNDFVVQDPLVSRYHAEIRLEDGEYVLHDLESTGGTFLNNRQIEKAVLHSGDIILLTSLPLMFMLDANAIERSANESTSDLEDELPVKDVSKNSEDSTSALLKKK